MFCSLSTVPTKKKTKIKSDAFDYVVPIAIFGVWTVLIIFGILTMLQPKWLADVGDKGRTEEALSLKGQADNVLRARQFAKSIKLYENVLRIDPEQKDAIGNIALAYRELGNYKKALKLFNGLIRKYPEQAHLNYINVAELYLKTDDKVMAAEYYKKAAEVSPEPDYACFRAAQFLIDLELYEEALVLINKGVNFRTSIRERYHGSLERDHYVVRNKDGMQEIVEDLLLIPTDKINITQYDSVFFENSLKKDKDLSRAYYYYGLSQIGLNNDEEAERYFESALMINPKFPEVSEKLNQIRSKYIK